ncbi:hypothetical protein A2U01_0114279, partial [Trifolium medium]|nr:hypothetical protein [Trifolium medium]
MLSCQARWAGESQRKRQEYESSWLQRKKATGTSRNPRIPG